MASRTSSMSVDASSTATAPSEAMMELLAPDGYYHYLGIEKPKPAMVTANTPAGDDRQQQHPFLNQHDTASNTTIDTDQVKKIYRKLSLRHHPDKGGDVETFRLLNRAQEVLTNSVLRQQYDILGIDLDDDDENARASDSRPHDHNDDNHKENSSSTTQGIVQEIAGMALTGILQLGVRTIMMGLISVFLVQYRLFLYPALMFLLWVAFNILQRLGSASHVTDVLSPIMIAMGLLCMHFGRVAATATDTATDVSPNNNSNYAATSTTTWIFWCGETLTIFMFTYNSLAASLPPSHVVWGGMSILSALAALFFRGMFWNYISAIVVIAVLAFFTAVAFPVMELLLEAILNEKLRKVGDKVRAHHAALDKYYKAKFEARKE